MRPPEYPVRLEKVEATIYLHTHTYIYISTIEL